MWTFDYDQALFVSLFLTSSEFCCERMTASSEAVSLPYFKNIMIFLLAFGSHLRYCEFLGHDTCHFVLIYLYVLFNLGDAIRCVQCQDERIQDVARTSSCFHSPPSPKECDLTMDSCLLVATYQPSKEQSGT